MAFLDTSLVALRESLEALLILGILLGIAKKLGAPAARRPLLAGALAGIGLSVLVGWLAQGAAHELYEANEALFEGVASLLAAAILTYMVVWMYRHTQGMMGTLHRRTKEALAVGRPGVLFGLAFVAVLREGLETVVFVAGKFPVDGAATTLLALLAGIAVSALLAFLVFSGFLRLSIERFMAATGLVLVVIAAGLLAYGVHELAEVAEANGQEWAEFPTAYDLRGTLPHKGYPDDPATAQNEADIDTTPEAVGTFLFGLVTYRANPTWLEVGVWVAYMAAMGAWVAAKLRKGPKGAATPAAPATPATPSAGSSAAPPRPRAAELVPWTAGSGSLRL